MLVRVRVPEHDLLEIAPQLDDAAVRRAVQECIEERSRRVDLVDRLEQRNEADAGDSGVHVDEAGLAGQHCSSEHVVGPARLRNDVRLDGELSKTIQRPAHGPEGFQRSCPLAAEDRRRRRQRPALEQLGFEQ